MTEDDNTITMSAFAGSRLRPGDRLEIHDSPSCGTLSLRLESGFRTVASITVFKVWQNPKSYFAWRCRRIKRWFMRRILRRKDYGTYTIASVSTPADGSACVITMRDADAEVRI